MADRFKVIIAVVFLVIVSAITATANDESTKIVTVNHAGEITKYQTKASTYEEFFIEQGFDLELIETSARPNQTLSNLENKVAMAYKIPITLKSNDEEKVYYFLEGITIREILNQTKTDTVEYVYELEDIDFPINEPYILNVKSINREFFTQDVEVPFETEIIEDNTMIVGQEEIVQYGVVGSGIQHKEVVYYEKEEIQHNDLQLEVVVEPVSEIKRVGTKEANTLNLAGTSIPPALHGHEFELSSVVYENVLTMNASAYTAGYESTGKRPGDRGYGITASGAVARPGTVAVDPRVIPLGTKLYVEGYGLAIAADTGGAIKGHKIDLFYENLSDALQFGRRNISVYVLK